MLVPLGGILEMIAAEITSMRGRTSTEKAGLDRASGEPEKKTY
jgi:hypothetical protein